jgi:MYXO-CTERM domain-containing protein
VLPVPGAAVTQTTGADPRQMTIQPSQLNAPGTPVNIGVFLANSNVFQVNTSVIINWPGNPAVFAASGRTGAATVTFCAGQVVTPVGQPGLHRSGQRHHQWLDALHADGQPVRRARSGQRRWRGERRAARRGWCTLRLRRRREPRLPGDLRTGDSEWYRCPGGRVRLHQRNRRGGACDGPVPHATVQANGVITGITPTGLGPGIANPATSYGAPWTTGMLTVSVTANVGPNPSVFVMSGADNRVNGVGTISMVSGSVSDRGTSGPNANRGWLNLNVGPSGTVPAMSVSGYAAAAGLIVLAGAFALRRRIFG